MNSLPKAPTTAQRAEIRRLLAAAEFDTRTITLMHTRIPGVRPSDVGKSVDGWIDRIASWIVASCAIQFLRAECGKDDDQ